MSSEAPVDQKELSPRDRVDAYVRLYERQMDHYHKTQDVEWKGSFGLWTLLGGGIYLVCVKRVDIGGYMTTKIILGAGCLVLLFLHLFWLWKIHRSEEYDKELWTQYRGEALRLIRGPGRELQSNENKYKLRSNWERTKWLVLEGGVTLALLLALLVVSICG